MLPRSLPRPPGAARALPGTYWGCQDDPKSREERCKSRQNRPKRRPGAFPTGPSERFRSGLAGHLAPNCPPRAPRRPPGGHFGPLGARFETLRGPLCEASAAECAPFRGALAIASRPFHSTAPEVKKVRECQNNTPPKGHPNNRWPRSPWLTKVVGGVAGAIVNTCIHCLKKQWTQ